MGVNDHLIAVVEGRLAELEETLSRYAVTVFPSCRASARRSTRTMRSSRCIDRCPGSSRLLTERSGSETAQRRTTGAALDGEGWARAKLIANWPTCSHPNWPLSARPTQLDKEVEFAL